MKHLFMRLIVFLFVLSQISCHEMAQSGRAVQRGRDTLAEIIADSLIRNDPWVRYTYTERQGKQLFEQYCVVCHGQSGEGDGFNAYNLNPRPHSLSDSTYMRTLTRETLSETISFGGKSVNKSVLMPAYQNTLSKTQLSNVVEYIETFTQTGSGH
jgi:cytochrome c oxidase cbb3-type subunit III